MDTFDWIREWSVAWESTFDDPPRTTLPATLEPSLHELFHVCQMILEQMRKGRGRDDVVAPDETPTSSEVRAWLRGLVRLLAEPKHETLARAQGLDETAAFVALIEGGAALRSIETAARRIRDNLQYREESDDIVRHLRAIPVDDPSGPVALRRLSALTPRRHDSQRARARFRFEVARCAWAHALRKGAPTPEDLHRVFLGMLGVERSPAARPLLDEIRDIADGHHRVWSAVLDACGTKSLSKLADPEHLHRVFACGVRRYVMSVLHRRAWARRGLHNAPLVGAQSALENVSLAHERMTVAHFSNPLGEAVARLAGRFAETDVEAYGRLDELRPALDRLPAEMNVHHPSVAQLFHEHVRAVAPDLVSFLRDSSVSATRWSTLEIETALSERLGRRAAQGPLDRALLPREIVTREELRDAFLDVVSAPARDFTVRLMVHGLDLPTDHVEVGGVDLWKPELRAGGFDVAPPGRHSALLETVVTARSLDEATSTARANVNRVLSALTFGTHRTATHVTSSQQVSDHTTASSSALLETAPRPVRVDAAHARDLSDDIERVDAAGRAGNKLAIRALEALELVSGHHGDETLRLLHAWFAIEHVLRPDRGPNGESARTAARLLVTWREVECGERLLRLHSKLVQGSQSKGIELPSYWSSCAHFLHPDFVLDELEEWAAKHQLHAGSLLAEATRSFRLRRGEIDAEVTAKRVELETVLRGIYQRRNGAVHEAVRFRWAERDRSEYAHYVAEEVLAIAFDGVLQANVDSPDKLQRWWDPVFS